jgi:hypothetical protein
MVRIGQIVRVGTGVLTGRVVKIYRSKDGEKLAWVEVPVTQTYPGATWIVPVFQIEAC